MKPGTASKKAPGNNKRLIAPNDAPPAPPCTLVIFGASGDLTHRLLVPALYNLARAGSLPDEFRIVGAARGPMSDDAFRADLTASMKKLVTERGGEFDEATLDRGSWGWLKSRIRYLAADLTAAAGYAALAELLPTLRGSGEDKGGGNVIFSLAVAASLFEPAIAHPREAQLLRQTKSAWRRVIIEKPFGHDLATAKELDRKLLRVLRERPDFSHRPLPRQGTVQNIMVLRFANGFFELLWNRQHIDHVQITASETVGVEERGSFYDATGALRDMVPNHLFQLLAMCATEAPAGPTCRSTSAPARRWRCAAPKSRSASSRCRTPCSASCRKRPCRPTNSCCAYKPEEGISMHFQAKVPGQEMQIGRRRHGFPQRRLFSC